MNAKERRGILGVAIAAMLLVALGVWLQCSGPADNNSADGEKLFEQISSSSSRDSVDNGNIGNKPSRKKKKSKGGKKRTERYGKKAKQKETEREIDVLTDTMPDFF